MIPQKILEPSPNSMEKLKNTQSKLLKAVNTFYILPLLMGRGLMLKIAKRTNSQSIR